MADYVAKIGASPERVLSVSQAVKVTDSDRQRALLICETAMRAGDSKFDVACARLQTSHAREAKAKRKLDLLNTRESRLRSKFSTLTK